MALLASASFLAVPFAYAEDHPCPSSDASLACKLTSVLHWLEAVAWILAIVFIAVVIIAFSVYRKNRAAHTLERR